MSKTNRDWHFASNHVADPDERVIIVWKAPVNARILHQTRQSLTAEINIRTAMRFIYTAMYASKLSAERTISRLRIFT